MEYDWGWSDALSYPNNSNTNGISSIQLNFASGAPVANQFTINAGPTIVRNEIPYDGGLYLQDRWTHKRITLSGEYRSGVFQPVTPRNNPTASIPDSKQKHHVCT